MSTGKGHKTTDGYCTNVILIDQEELRNGPAESESCWWELVQATAEEQKVTIQEHAVQHCDVKPSGEWKSGWLESTWLKTNERN